MFPHDFSRTCSHARQCQPSVMLIIVLVNAVEQTSLEFYRFISDMTQHRTIFTMERQ